MVRLIRFITGLVLGLVLGWNARKGEIEDYRVRIQQKDREIQNLRTRLKEQEAILEQSRARQSPDDLSEIEGIGPKIAALLQEHDIDTFSKLAKSPTGRLEEILAEANLRMFNPATWPDQARLAAEDRWKELEALKQELKGGRRA
jgi:predicted flap endonuclease-1-like 5' DNA nuclease